MSDVLVALGEDRCSLPTSNIVGDTSTKQNVEPDFETQSFPNGWWAQRKTFGIEKDSVSFVLILKCRVV